MLGPISFLIAFLYMTTYNEDNEETSAEGPKTCFFCHPAAFLGTPRHSKQHFVEPTGRHLWARWALGRVGDPRFRMRYTSPSSRGFLVPNSVTTVTARTSNGGRADKQTRHHVSKD